MATDTPTLTLARDEFTATRRSLDAHPEAVKSKARIDVVDPYDNVTTWVLDLYRLEGDVTALVQRMTGDNGTRFVLPPAVTAALASHQASLVTKARSKAGKRVAANKKALGLPVGNPAALKLARAMRSAEARLKARKHK